MLGQFYTGLAGRNIFAALLLWELKVKSGNRDTSRRESEF